MFKEARSLRVSSVVFDTMELYLQSELTDEEKANVEWMVKNAFSVARQTGYELSVKAKNKEEALYVWVCEHPNNDAVKVVTGYGVGFNDDKNATDCLEFTNEGNKTEYTVLGHAAHLAAGYVFDYLKGEKNESKN